MDAEYVKIDKTAAEIVNKAKLANKRVCTVGTTSMRAVETAVAPTNC